MILLGVLLMLACAALAVDAVVQNTHVMHVVAFNQGISHLSLGAIFIAGAVLGCLFAFGLALFTGGLGRASRARRERRMAARETDAQTEALRADNKRLQQELARRATEAPATAYPTDPSETEVPASGGRHRVRR
jgi:type VI protein secretion system component VasK